MNISLSEISESSAAQGSMQKLFVALGDSGEIALTLAGFKHYKVACAKLDTPVNLARVKTLSDLTALNCKLARAETKHCLAELICSIESDEYAYVAQSILDGIFGKPKAQKAVVYEFPGRKK